MSDSYPQYESISLLIQPSKAGDAAAQADLLSQLQGYVHSVAQQHLEPSLRQKAGYSDIMQLTMTQVIQNFDQFKGATGAEFRGWLKTIVVNEINRVRRTFHAAKRDIAKERDLEEKDHSRYIGQSPVDCNPTPSSEAIAREQVQTFQKILRQLPPDYAAVVQLRSIEQLTFKEIAERTNKSLDSVTKLWYRAVLKLEEKLTEHDVDF